MTNSQRLTQAELKEIIIYDPLSGVFTWRVDRMRGRYKVQFAARAGTRAGFDHHSGYRYLTLFNKRYPESHIAWLYMTGEFPKKEVDHRNRRRNDNRWSNLRDASRKQNMENFPVRCDSTSGVRGVCWDTTEGKWRAYIYHNKRQVHIGHFKHKTKAVAARREAEDQLFTHHTP